MHNITVCEGSLPDAALLQNILDDYELAKNESLNVKCFTDAESMLDYFSHNDYFPDVLLIDISLPGISGLEAVKILRNKNFCGEIIFAASSGEYALSAFEVNACAYFVKPLDGLKIFAALEKLLFTFRDAILVKEKRALRKIKCSEILYCETDGKYQIIHTRSEEIRVRLSSRAMRDLCPPPPPPRKFTSLGSAYLINLENINVMSEMHVIFDGGKELILSRRKFQELKRKLKDFYEMI